MDKNTPLHQEHVNLKALMAPFAGWNMPIHYGSILDEAKHARTAVSLFDISHMGEFIIRENPSKSSLDAIVTNPVVKMKTQRCRYGFLLNDDGKILDDLIAYRIAADEWMLVVNAANEQKDMDAIRRQLSTDASFENISSRIVKLDLQGPGSLAVLKAIVGDEVKRLTYYGFQFFSLLGGNFIISRTGYTGELGFEIYVDSSRGVELWQTLLKNPAVKPAGLGARDILRLEMGLPLYGNEFNEDLTPLDAGMERFLDMEKEFTGRKALLEQQKRGVPRRLVGFAADGRRTPRHENRILSGDRDAGFVTSGVFSPHLNKGIGMGYVDAALGAEGTAIGIDTGKGVINASVEKIPFLKNTSIKYSEV
ncbi:MAG TPA: glycine cleavage system aminomethyltransferase GcvT [Spirochaetota bacterium]|nr:glycine cleavage system aminomethyltransferase GcvT [Spirochaetota bacterium]HPC42444.1 glycine cleavage system aminomethyltransferase GcvT [Spirochaetota bacterium]HPL17403.1 glycine cleavage system aminomethyltransferase GcvT [Spirochaetota bacterium]HQF06569.1 glycine cleavage system aminomethyltransferase GcvT [Spirochaetota bacterium]HQH96028.1 glycine cleavage system aminomethyltransferase GcvT [Spirochaetota bacterium]